jgi:hypothetical protein
MTENSFGFQGGVSDPRLVDEWHTHHAHKAVMYTVRSDPSKTAYIYTCCIIEEGKERAASETQFGTVILTRNEVERLPRFVDLLAGTLPL